MENLLLALAVLACPVGMGVMMWVMIKGQRNGDAQNRPAQNASLEQLRAEQQRLDSEIERLKEQDGERGRSHARS
jgi:cell division protein FtsB